MHPFAAVAAKVAGSASAAALLSLGVASGLQAATPTPTPSPSTANVSHADRKLVRMAALEAEADVLGLKPEQLRDDLKKGAKVSDLAKAKGLTQEQFAGRLVVAIKPRLEQLVDSKHITQAQADRILDRIQHGHIPWWNGVHRHKA